MAPDHGFEDTETPAIKIGKDITDTPRYNASMRKTIFDKLFFVDKVEATVFVDFGCADASLITELNRQFPENVYIGYDTNEEMIEASRAACREQNVLFMSDWENVKQFVAKARLSQHKNVCLILSSVIHEVYSYGTLESIEKFWNDVFCSGFKYIAIRDMIPSVHIDRPSEINDIAKIYRKADKNLLYSFEKIWGSIESNRNLVHFLMKYRYADSWDREVRENYFPIFRENVLGMIPDEYKILFHEHFILPYSKTTVDRHFGIDLKDNTHLKLILRRQVG